MRYYEHVFPFSSLPYLLNLIVILAYLPHDLIRYLVRAVQLRNSTSRQCWTMQQHKITYYILSSFTSTIIPLLSVLSFSDLFIYNFSRLSRVSSVLKCDMQTIQLLSTCPNPSNGCLHTGQRLYQSPVHSFNEPIPLWMICCCSILTNSQGFAYFTNRSPFKITSLFTMKSYGHLKSRDDLILAKSLLLSLPFVLVTEMLQSTW